MTIARHTAYNVVGAVLPIAVSLVTVPVYLKVIGLDRYGVLNLCWLLVGYFGLFDFGLGRATAQHVATLHDKEDVVRSRAFWTGLSLSAGLAIIATLIAIPIGWFALIELKLGNPSLRTEVQGALPFLVAAVPMAIFQSVLKGALEGRSQFFIVNAVLSAGAIATGVLPLASAILWRPDLRLLVAVSLSVRFLLLVVLAIAAVYCVPVARYEHPDPQDLRKMTRFGAWLTISNIVGPIMVFADRFLIGALAGAAAVALYVIPFNVISQLVLIPSSLSNALFPRFAASKQSIRVKSDALLAATFVLTPMSMAALLLVGPFLRLWIGEMAAGHSTPVAIALIVGFWANGLAQIPCTGLVAAGRTDITAKVHMIEVVPYLLLLWVGLTYFGLIGAAIAWSIRGTADFIALAVLDRADVKVLRVVLFHGLTIISLVIILSGTEAGSAIRWTLVTGLCLAMAVLLVRRVPDVILQYLLRYLPPDSVRRWLPR